MLQRSLERKHGKKWGGIVVNLMRWRIGNCGLKWAIWENFTTSLFFLPLIRGISLGILVMLKRNTAELKDLSSFVKLAKNIVITIQDT